MAQDREVRLTAIKNSGRWQIHVVPIGSNGRPLDTYPTGPKVKTKQEIKEVAKVVAKNIRAQGARVIIVSPLKG